MKYKVVPLNPKTGKEIKRPKRGQPVIFAVKGPKGGLSKLQKEPQKYYVTDRDSLTRQISNTKDRNFIVYQQLTNEKDKKTKQRKVKITGANPRRKQRGLLFVKGKRKRHLDMAYKTGNVTKSHEQEPLKVGKVHPWSQNAQKPLEIILKGDTIKDALAGLHVNLSMTDFVRPDMFLYYTARIKITDPEGKVLEIPVNGSYISKGFDSKGYLFIDNKIKAAMTNKVEVVANLTSNIAHSIRIALKEQGLRFTSLVKLQQIEKKEIRRIKTLDDYEDVATAEYALDSLFTIHRTPVKNLKQITKKWQVKLYIVFELY